MIYYKMNKLKCLIVYLSCLSNVIGPPIKYPLTLGAFKSNTYIDDILVLPSNDIVILGASSDN